MKVPTFLPYESPQIDANVIEILSQSFKKFGTTQCPHEAVKTLERALSEHYGKRPTRAAASASACIEFALKIAGVQAGDEVITTPFALIKSVNNILKVGAHPVFVDIDPHTKLMDLNRLHASITPKTKAILSVDVAGFPVERLHLYSIALEYGLRVIENATHAMGATSHGVEIGNSGDLVIFSFSIPSSIGNGACLLMNYGAEARQFEQLRNNGILESQDIFEVELLGDEAQMSEVSAIFALHQLKSLSFHNARRRELAQYYFSALADLPIELPPPDFVQSSWHRFYILLPTSHTHRRAEIMRRMREEAGIGLGAYFPPSHLMKIFRRFGYKEGDFPNAEYVCSRILNLPLYPSMQLHDITRVATALRKIMNV